MANKKTTKKRCRERIKYLLKKEEACGLDSAERRELRELRKEY